MISDASPEIRNMLSPDHKTRALLLYKMVSNSALEMTVPQNGIHRCAVIVHRILFQRLV